MEIVDDAGRRFAATPLAEGLDGITRLHALIARFAPGDWAELDPGEAEARVKVGIETDRGTWEAALVSAPRAIAHDPGVTPGVDGRLGRSSMRGWSAG